MAEKIGNILKMKVTVRNKFYQKLLSSVTYDIKKNANWISKLLSKRSYKYKCRMLDTTKKITLEKKKKKNICFDFFSTHVLDVCRSRVGIRRYRCQVT